MDNNFTELGGSKKQMDSSYFKQSRKYRCKKNASEMNKPNSIPGR